ncbi:hypothetical protein JHK82_032028 [Glycine max]|nr:hypothetical protein JHK86_032126 [Glycine max]KAG5125291.1 hypothetical protein JHK82_032028 [Glycine max]
MNQNGSVKRVLWESFDYPTDVIIPGMKLSQKKQALITRVTSSQQLSFFQYEGSENIYLGVRPTADNSSDSYFWIANRGMPIRDPLVVLTIDQYGNMKIVSKGGNSTIMLYSSSEPESNNNNNSTISAILQDNDNFRLHEMNQDGSEKRRLWESFDYPAFSILSGMKLGFNRKTGHNWSITSWIGEVISLLCQGLSALALTTKRRNWLFGEEGRLFGVVANGTMEFLPN